ncbi:FkbM family methyltransferase [Xanthobacter flavus]|uniref:FkbM family methyltransferase n=1 Tax=Xanthobacter flavus TaxID=281 RepID=UPI0037265407
MMNLILLPCEIGSNQGGNPAMSAFKKAILSGLDKTQILDRLRGLKYKSESHSQFGEDVHIEGYYRRLKHELSVEVNDGYIVDIGAFSPIMHSNSYNFFKRGWKSINIDPTPGTKNRFDRIRSSDINLELAVASVEGVSTFYVFGRPSVWNTMSETAAQVAEELTGIRPEKVPVQIRRLDSILDEFAPKDKKFEILSIDAEGLDEDILKSSNFSKYRPRIVLVEVHSAELNNISQHPVVSLMYSEKYVLHSWINPNFMFVDAEYSLHRDI